MIFFIFLDSSRQEEPKKYKILIKQWKKFNKNKKTQKSKELKKPQKTYLERGLSAYVKPNRIDLQTNVDQ